MRIIYTLIFTLLIFSASSQTTIVMQPDGLSGIDANVASFDKYNNYGDQLLLQAFQWTTWDDTIEVRAFFKFDLSEIPEGMDIESALLSLYGNEEASSATTAHFTEEGTNQSYVSRVIEPWDEHFISWVNQPNWTDEDQILLPTSLTYKEDYLNYNITKLINYQYKNPAGNFGFVIHNKVKEPHRSMCFLSSDHFKSSRRPKLTVTYTESADIPENILQNLTIYPNPASSKISLKFNESLNPSEKVTINITDLIGNNVYSGIVDNPNAAKDISVSHLPAGIYFVRIRSGENITLRKLIVKD